MSALDSSLNERVNLKISGHLLDKQLQTIQLENRFVRLRSKLWHVLIHLAENQNNLVTRQELIALCWNGNGYTGEQGLTHTVCHLRRILKRYNIQAKITTIPKRGYVLQDTSIEFKQDNMVHIVQYSQDLMSHDEQPIELSVSNLYQG
ncbi:MAG: winged helix-turn-helix domain-containing protein [Kangiellaceae bacterium]|nr:winged helix-turn-helix domain-containing protein [Kangiellaceae bacterium]